MAIDSATGRMLLHGGREQGGYSAETWQWDSATRSWSNVSQQSGGPGFVHYGSLVFDSKKNVFIHFGGYSATSTPQNAGPTYEFSSGTWAQKFAGAPAPSLRHQFPFVFDESSGMSVLFGGCVLGPGRSIANDETWLYSPDTGWEQIASSTLPQRPPSRCAASMAYDPVRQVVSMFGGCNYESGECFKDYWEWSTVTRRWTPGPNGMTPAVLPTARSGARMAWFPPLRRMVMHGGTFLGSTQTTTSELWFYGGP